MAHFHIDTVSDFRKATIVEVEFVLDNGEFWTGYGSSKKAAGDEYDYSLGELIAATRAIDTLLNHKSKGLKIAVQKRVKAIDLAEK